MSPLFCIGRSTVYVEVVMATQQSVTIKVFDVIGKEVFSEEEGTINGSLLKQFDFGSLSHRAPTF